MPGRHSSRRSGRRIAALPATAVLLVLALGGWLVADYAVERIAGTRCAGVERVEIAADPSIAQALSDVAATGEQRQRAAAGCYQLDVVSQEAADVADRLTGAAPGGEPDVWVPESTFWLRRAKAGGAATLPDTGAPVATSPVVLAVAEPAARRIGWPGRSLTWPDVLGASPTADALNVGIQDPARNPVGLSALFGVRTLDGATTPNAGGGAAGQPGASPVQVAALRRLSPNVAPRTLDLYSQVGAAYDPAAADGAVDAFPTSEQALVRHNGTDRDQLLVPVYAQGAVPVLDYPYVVLPNAIGVTRTAAEEFLTTVTDPAHEDLLQARGLRTPLGDAGSAFPRTDLPGAPRPGSVPPVQLPEAATTDSVLRVWTGVNVSSRAITVIDVSGSMGAQVPGTGMTRAQITTAAAQEGMRLFKPTTDMGLWVFSENLDGDSDHRELAPIGPMSAERDRLIALVDQVPALVGGRTNLFDTVLAAYRAVQQGWDPARLNLVLVMTDGRDDDVSSVDRQGFVDELTRLQDPARPVQIVFVGLGPDVDAADLDQLAGVTGGRAFTSADITGIRTVFAAALAELTKPRI